MKMALRIYDLGGQRDGPLAELLFNIFYHKRSRMDGLKTGVSHPHGKSKSLAQFLHPRQFKDPKHINYRRGQFS